MAPAPKVPGSDIKTHLKSRFCAILKQQGRDVIWDCRPTCRYEEIFSKYVSQNRPVIITRGAIESWPANKAWSRSALLKDWGDMPVKVGSKPQNGPGPHPQSWMMTLGEYINKTLPDTEEGLDTTALDVSYVRTPFADVALDLAFDVVGVCLRATCSCGTRVPFSTGSCCKFVGWQNWIETWPMC